MRNEQALGLVSLRLRRVLSQADLARESGVSLRQIKRLEKGVCYPWPRTSRTLAAFFGVPVDALYKLPAEPYRSERERGGW